MDEKRFNEVLDEEYMDENFRPLIDNREAIKAIRAKYAGVKFSTRRVEMTDERIEEILRDPNTWNWDGCTYPEDNPYSKDFEENLKKYFDGLKEQGT